ncbi:MAG: helix-turn-helix domain-containing protein [Ruminococcus sp.]
MQHYQRIRDLREDSDLTQGELCKKLYMHKTTYTNYEQGKHTVPLDFAVLLADFYDVSLDYIAGRTNSPHNNTGTRLAPDEQNILEKFSQLTERNKGKLELFLDQLFTQQQDQLHLFKEAQ